MDRPIHGPNTDSPYLDGDEAGKWVGGFRADLFESLMAQHLPTVQPVYMGRYKMWAWLDVAVLAYILKRSPTVPPTTKRGQKVSVDSETETN